MTEEKRDPLVNFKNTKITHKDGGELYFSLSMSTDQAQELVNAISQSITPRGVKLDIHTKKRTSESGRAFDSSFTFVKGIQEPRNQTAVGSGTTFVPKKLEPSTGAAEAQAAASSLLNTAAIK